MIADLTAINQQAQRYLARREHGVQELRQKLLRKGYDLVAINEVLDTLKEKKWLSDSRFQQAFVHHYVRKGYGPKVIWARLALRCDEVMPLDHADVENVEWLAVAYTWVTASGRSQGVHDYGKISQALYRRGFDSEQIAKTVRRLKEEEAYS